MNKLLFVIIVLIITNFLNAQNGILKTYHLSGKIEARISYVDEILEGTSFWYYENGYLRSEKNYSNGKPNGIDRNYYKNGLMKDEIHIINGILDGVSRRYYDNGGLKEVTNYDRGKLISKTNLDYDANFIAPLSAYKAGKRKRNLNNTDFLCEMEICPEPVGGLSEIENKIIYPELAKQFQLEGTVIITATISKMGIPTNIIVGKELGLGCSEAAVEAVKNTKFVPAGNNGEVVSSEVTFKLNFALTKRANLKTKEINKDIILADKENPEELIEEVKLFISCDVDECPEPIGGITGLIKNLRYPPHAKRNNISGDVIISAKVNDLGFVIKAEVVKKLGHGCDEAAKSVVIKTQFEPGKKNGKSCESIINITIPFILN